MYTTEDAVADRVEPSETVETIRAIEMDPTRHGLKDPKVLARVFWCLAVLSILIWSQVPSYVVGWDVQVYKTAISSLQAGHDPYADAIAVETAYQHDPKAYIGDPIPYCYVYSPITLPLLRSASKLPKGLVGAAYWLIYFFCIAMTLWVCLRLVESSQEKAVLGLFATLAIFFPGMLYNDAFFSGNIAYILYGLVLMATLRGWRHNRWLLFYFAVLLAGCCKTPMLTLLVIPIFSARRQWLPAVATGAAGMATFLLQPMRWPTLFRHYLQAVDLQFQFNRDFSSSPAGLIANALFFRVPYRITSAISYLSYATVIVVVLFLLSRRFLAGRLTLDRFAPVLLVGTILLNPRIMEYDIAPITIPVVLIVWRIARRGRTVLQASVGMAVVFTVINFLASRSHVGLSNPPWKVTAGCFLVAVFATGVWQLFRESRDESPVVGEPDAELVVLAS